MPVVVVEGARQLRSQLRKAGDDLSDLKQAHTDVAAIAGRAAVGRSPRRADGKLASTVRWSGTKTAGIIRAGRASVPYAGPIHWGWPAHNITAQPFISEAAVDTEPEWFGVFENYVDRVLAKIKGLQQ